MVLALCDFAWIAISYERSEKCGLCGTSISTISVSLADAHLTFYLEEHQFGVVRVIGNHYQFR